MRAHFRPFAGLLLGGLLTLVLIGAVSVEAAARAPSAKLTVSISETPFAPNEVDTVLVGVHFPGKSSGFSYRISRRSGSHWLLLRSVSRSGSFSGTRSMSMLKLYGRKPIAIGRYRVDLSAGGKSAGVEFVVVKALKTATVAVSAGSAHSCALVSGGRVKCWGDNHLGAFGDRSTTSSTTPVAASGIANAKAVSTGAFFTCALLPLGKIKCWGDNSNGKLGAGPHYPPASSIPIPVGGIAHAVAISSGADHSCALLAGGTVRCWGRNNSGDIGSGAKSSNPVPVAVRGITSATSISAGYRHNCAVLGSGKVACWGNNKYGQLGNGKTRTSKVSVTVRGVSKAVAVSAGNDHSCAVLRDHSIRCWGLAASGQLGDGSLDHGHADSSGFDFSTAPVKVKGITTATAVVAGSGFSCARLSNKQLRCWGSNVDGELGNGAVTSSSVPVAVSEITTATALSASAGSRSAGHSCVLLSGGTVKCWGSNQYGELGSKSQNYSTTPVVSSVVNATRLAAGDTHSCALLTGGAVVCWGGNGNGQLGDGTASDSLAPVRVKAVGGAGDLANATTISVGSQHSCALLSGGGVVCWGANANGQLGDGTTTSSSIPVTVKAVGGAGDLSGVTAIGAGYQHSCALLSSGAVVCWGNNTSGRLGDGTLTSSSTPVTVKAVGGASDLAGVTAISVGYQHSCALLISGAVNCWGGNANSQLGDGTASDSLTPVAVKAVGGSDVLSGVISIGAGYQHSCALLAGGTIDCWGNNANGQLGDGTTTVRQTPVAVTGVGGGGGLSGVSSLGVGYQHTCALLSGGTVDCWGSSANGQLGDGAISDRTTPVKVKGLGGTGDLSGVSAISPGYQHTCALITGGTVDCWGSNAKSQLGGGELAYNSLPAAVVGLP